MHQVHPLLGLFETLPHPVDVSRVQGWKRHGVELQAVSVHQEKKKMRYLIALRIMIYALRCVDTVEPRLPKTNEWSKEESNIKVGE